MKKATTLLSIALGLSLSASAQTPQQTEYYKLSSSDKVSVAQSEEYLQVSLAPTDWGKNYKARLEFADKTISIEEYIKSETKKERTYPTAVAVMNALNEMGWEFAGYIPDSEGRTAPERFLMKRKIVKA
ncbi:hypothetical protein ACSX1A_02935 [Pontibacter sp. MBLB2868]|uniref:hypothetical protein n=1 Tax=Pontibacter sp. MBLB2868 TaxID=3451555 RepID=UPI003F74DE1E